MVTRFGIIGFGWVAQDYMLPTLLAHPETALRAVVSVRDEDFERLPPQVSAYTSAAEMLAHETLDAVYIASPNYLHATHVEQCMAAGVDVLCEKPLAHTYAAALQLGKAVRASQGHFATAFDQRHHPAHRLLADWVARRVDWVRSLRSGWTTPAGYPPAGARITGVSTGSRAGGRGYHRPGTPRAGPAGDAGG